MNKIYISNYIFRSVCIIGAILMAFNGIKGWGWLVFVAAITGLSTEKENDDERWSNDSRRRKGLWTMAFRTGGWFSMLERPVNNNHFKNLCGNYACLHCSHDRCTAPSLNGTVAYEFKGNVDDSTDNCKQFKCKGSMFF